MTLVVVHLTRSLQIGLTGEVCRGAGIAMAAHFARSGAQTERGENPEMEDVTDRIEEKCAETRGAITILALVVGGVALVVLTTVVVVLLLVR